MTSSAFGGGLSGQTIAVDSAGTGLEWVTPFDSDYISINCNGLLLLQQAQMQWPLVS